MVKKTKYWLWKQENSPLSLVANWDEREKEKEYDKEIGRNKTKTMRKKLYEIIKRLNKHN